MGRFGSGGKGFGPGRRRLSAAAAEPSARGRKAKALCFCLGCCSPSPSKQTSSVDHRLLCNTETKKKPRRQWRAHKKRAIGAAATAAAVARRKPKKKIAKEIESKIDGGLLAALVPPLLRSRSVDRHLYTLRLTGGRARGVPLALAARWQSPAFEAAFRLARQRSFCRGRRRHPPRRYGSFNNSNTLQHRRGRVVLGVQHQRTTSPGGGRGARGREQLVGGAPVFVGFFRGRGRGRR